MIFRLIGIYTIILLVNSLPQNPEDAQDPNNLFDSISLNADCDTGPNNQPIKQRDATGFPDDSTSQDGTGFPDDTKNRDGTGFPGGPMDQDFTIASSNVDSAISADEVAPKDLNLEMNDASATNTIGTIGTIDNTLLADDGMARELHGAKSPSDIGWCPRGKRLACCYGYGHWNGKTWVRRLLCNWRSEPYVVTCNGGANGQWLCCGPMHDVPDHPQKKPEPEPDPEDCDYPWAEPQLPPPPTHVPTDIPQEPPARKPADEQPANPRPICPVRVAPQRF